MAIDTEHADYAKRKPQWQKLRDCVEGQETVHQATTQYLPKLSGQTDAEYKAYRDRAAFYGATSRTVDGLSGMVFRKDPVVEIPEGLKPYTDDITLTGLSLVDFAEQLIDDDIVVGRAGILVDHPSTAANTTVAQAEASNIRPFLKHYAAEQIFNWKTESRNNAEVVTQVRLWEWVEQPGEGEFDEEMIAQIRVLDLDEAGRYRQRIFRKSDDEKDWLQFGEEIIPLRNNAPLNVVPFFFVGVKNGSSQAEKPPLIDLANVNISHYKTTADLEHGAHFTGLPTAVITGHSDDPESPAEYRIGAATAWVFPSPETDVKYLEFNGQGLEALEKRLLKKEEYMAFLGARMLSPDKKGVEAAETAQIHRTGEISVLASLTNSTSRTLEAALSFLAEWAGIGGEIKIKLNTDFVATKMSAQELLALFQTYQGGGMAFKDFLHNLKRGEIIAEDRTEDDILSDMEGGNPFPGEDLPPDDDEDDDEDS